MMVCGIPSRGCRMNDLISRQAALDALGDEPEIWTDNDEYALGLNNQWHYDRSAILACESIQNVPNGDLISRKALIDFFLAEGMPTAAVYTERIPPAQPKKKLLFSDRQEIVNEYKKWCLINNVDGCAESFLAYLCIKGYIDG